MIINRHITQDAQMSNLLSQQAEVRLVRGEREHDQIGVETVHDVRLRPFVCWIDKPT
jgi:hypothetical protein